MKVKFLKFKGATPETYMNKGYSIYLINKKNLIDSVSKSTLYYQKIIIRKTVILKKVRSR